MCIRIFMFALLDDSDSDSGDDDEPGGAGCTGGEVPTAGKPVISSQG